MRQVLYAVASALLMWLSFPPVNLGVLVFVAPVPLLWALRRARTAREAGWLGFTFGFLFFGSLLYWIMSLGVVAWFPLTTVMGLWAAGYGLILFVARNWSPWRWWLVAVGGWALWEFLRARWPFGGFPWGSVGYPVGTLSWPRGAAQWIGASGWGVVAVAFAAGVVLMLDEERDRRPLEIASGLILTLTLLGAVFAPYAAGAPVRVAVVQGNSPCPRVHCEGEKVRIYSSHMALTNQIPAGDVDLVVWGESSFGGAVNPTFNGDVRRDMGDQAARIGAYLLAGGTRPAREGEFDNYNILFGPEGQVIGEYMKRHPVPFGEYVPFRRVLQFIPQLEQVPNDMNRGSAPVVWTISVDGEQGGLGSVISFEGAFARLMRDTVRAGARLVVVNTNEASYGVGPASDQLIGMVRMSAASLGVDVVVAAITGKSTVVRADGSVGRTTDLFTEEVLFGRANFQESRRTVFAVAGPWLQMLAIALGLMAGFGTVGGPTRAFKIRPERRR